MKSVLARTALVCTTIALLIAPSRVNAQSPTERLDRAIAQVRAGAFVDALLVLNDLVADLGSQPAAAPTLARAHAYRAAAYLGLNQRERAMAAALLAVRADPNLVVAPPEFSPDVVKLFADPASVASPRPAPKPENAVKPEIAAKPSPAPAAPAAPVGSPATIYLYRPGNFIGSSGRAKVVCDGVEAAEMQNGRSLMLKAAPGNHTLKVGHSEVQFTAEGGGEYYFRIGPGVPDWRLKLEDRKEGAAEFREKNLKSNDEKRTFGTKCGVYVPAKSKK